MPSLVNLHQLEADNCVKLQNLKGLKNHKQLETLKIKSNDALEQIYDILMLQILENLTISIYDNSSGLLDTCLQSSSLKSI